MTVFDKEYTRRRFLQVSGAVGATVVAAGLLEACSPAASRGRHLQLDNVGRPLRSIRSSKTIEDSAKIIASISQLAGNAEGFAKLKEVKGQLDMMSADALWVRDAYHKEGLIEPFDINELAVA